MRVCLVGAEKDRNCCRCEKCIRTILSFRAWGIPKPACFEFDVNDRQIIGLRYFHEPLFYGYAAIIKAARQNGQTGNWIQAVQVSMRLNRIRQMGQKVLYRVKRGAAKHNKHYPPPRE